MWKTCFSCIHVSQAKARAASALCMLADTRKTQGKQRQLQLNQYSSHPRTKLHDWHGNFYFCRPLGGFHQQGVAAYFVLTAKAKQTADEIKFLRFLGDNCRIVQLQRAFFTEEGGKPRVILIFPRYLGSLRATELHFSML